MNSASIVERLKSPGSEFTQMPFWFWNGELDPETMREQLREMARQGVYGACPHPRHGMDRRLYLEKPFWDAMDACIDEAKRLGSKILLYDEYNWPSGGAGGRVTDGHPELYPRGLDYCVRELSGPGPAEISCIQPLEKEGCRFEKIVAAFIVPADCPAVDAVSERSASSIQPWGEIAIDGASVNGELSSGLQRILVFFQAKTSNPSPLDIGSDSFVDFLNPETAKRFIALTHEEYRKRYGQDFGKTITGIFTDEPSVISAGPFPWTDKFPEEFRRRRGYDLTPHLPALCDDAFPGGWRHRAAYWQTVSELMVDSFIKPISEWCRANGIAFTGHFLDERISSWTAAPHMMNWQRQLDICGLDALGPHSKAAFCKIPASVAHLQGKRLLCECLGLADGWNTTSETARAGIQFLGIVGVDLQVPHGFHQTIDNPRNECPPSFFEPNPLWRHYSRIAGISDRLGAFNRTGTHCAPLAVYYPIESLWADGTGGRGQGGKPWEALKNGNACAKRTIDSFNSILEAVSYGQWDCDVVDATAIAEASFEEAAIRIGPESFACIVLPAMRTIDSVSARKIAMALDAGVHLAIVGDAPSHVLGSCEEAQEAAAQLASAMERRSAQTHLCRNASELLSQIEKAIPQASVIRFPDGKPEKLLVQARKDGEASLWLFVNDQKTCCKFKAFLPCGPDARATQLLAIEIDGGSSFTPTFEVADGGCLLNMELDELEAVAIVAGADVAALVNAQAPARRRPPMQAKAIELGPWSIQVDPPLCKLPLFKMRKRGWEAMRGWNGREFDDSSWTKAVAGRSALGMPDAQSVLLRCVLPPGACALRRPLPFSGEYELFVNGQLVERNLGPVKPEGELDLRPFIGGLSDVLAVEVSSHSSLSGILAPLEVRCEPVALPVLKPWTEIGLDWYSGLATYRCEWNLTELSGEVWIDLGDVQHDAELRVNGLLASVLPWPPYRAEISKFLKVGANAIEVSVANTFANHFVWDDWSVNRSGVAYGKIPRIDPSGLQGPVRVRMA